MYYLTRSLFYKLDYEFCQTDTPIIGPQNKSMNDAVVEEHGICTVLSMDWLKAKFADTNFVVTFQSVWEKARQYKKKQRYASQVYSDYAPNLRQGNVIEYDVTNENCVNIAGALADGYGAAIHIGDSDDRSIGNGGHLISLYRSGDTYYMFDCNFGSYHANGARGCAAWLWAICSEDRPKRGRYKDWASKLVFIPYH